MGRIAILLCTNACSRGDAMSERVAVFLDLRSTLGGEGLDDSRHFAFYTFAIQAIKLINEAKKSSI